MAGEVTAAVRDQPRMMWFKKISRYQREGGSLPPMTITSSVFEAFLKCPTKGWLRATGEHCADNTYAVWVQSRNEAYRAEGMRRLSLGVSDDEYVGAPSAGTLTTAKWRVAVNVTVRCVSSISAPFSRQPQIGEKKAAKRCQRKLLFPRS